MATVIMTMEDEVCCTCGIAFSMPALLKRQRQNDKKAFYCPNGHLQYYTGESLADQVKRLKEQLQTAHDELNAKHDCPDCGGWFRDVARHKRRVHRKSNGH